MRAFAVAIGTAFACLVTLPTLADEVLYCSDTEAAGFKWEGKEEPRAGNFKLQRFSIKIESDTDRTITQTSAGDELGMRQFYTCEKAGSDRVICNIGIKSQSWLFVSDKYYVRTFLAGGPPSTGLDPNILISYGTCTKF